MREGPCSCLEGPQFRWVREDMKLRNWARREGTVWEWARAHGWGASCPRQELWEGEYYKWGRAWTTEPE